MIKKVTFSKVYPLLEKYITSESIRNNMLDNKDLIRKYNEHEELINSFVNELDKFFDIETINNIVTETILKLPDTTLVSFMTAYLASDDVAKSNADVLVFYKKTTVFGIECTKYIEENGIITNRSYKNIPLIVRNIKLNQNKLQLEEINLMLNKEYEELSIGNESFNEETLSNIYKDLDVPEKKLVNDLLRNKSFQLLDVIFERFNFNLNPLLKLLTSVGIDSTLINNELLTIFNNYEYMIFIYEIIYSGSLLTSSRLKKLLQDNRKALVKELVTSSLIYPLDKLSEEEFNNTNDIEIINKLAMIKKEYKPEIKEVA